MKEADLQRTILDYLRLHRVFYWRNNSGAAKVGDRFIRFGCTGSPDIFVMDGKRIIGIEIKGSKGKQSPAQVEFERSFRFAGGTYILARRLEDVQAEITR